LNLSSSGLKVFKRRFISKLSGPLGKLAVLLGKLAVSLGKLTTSLGKLPCPLVKLAAAMDIAKMFNFYLACFHLRIHM
jgi:hypothetical protein